MAGASKPREYLICDSRFHCIREQLPLPSCDCLACVFFWSVPYSLHCLCTSFFIAQVNNLVLRPSGSSAYIVVVFLTGKMWGDRCPKL